MVWLQGLTFCRRSKFSIRRTRKSLTWSGASRRRKMPISILLGNYPQAVPRGRPLVEQPLPPEVPPGMPSSLIERRPDIREAEQVLVSANAQIGVAKAQFFPQIALTGSGGGSFGRSSSSSSLLGSNVGIWLKNPRLRPTAPPPDPVSAI